MKKIFLGFLLVTSLTVGSYAASGAQLVLQTKDGQIISGELLAVKHHCLILKDASGVGLNQDIDDLVILSVRKGSHLLAGLGIGLAAGTAMGAGIGYASGQDDWGHRLEDVFYVYRSRAGSAMIGAVLGALGGAVAGAVIGHAASAPTTINLGGKSPEEIERIIAWLRSKARFPKESY